METTEPTESIPPEYSLPDLSIGQEGKAYLYTAGKWAKFLGIMGFTATGIMVLVAIIVSVSVLLISGSTSSSGSFASTGLSVLSMLPLVPIVILYFFMSYFLYQFGVNIKNAIAINDTTFATKAFRNLKSHFKLIGIVLIITIICYIVVFIASIVMVGLPFMHH